MNDLLLFDIDEDVRTPSIPTSRMKFYTIFGVLVWFVGALVAGWSGVLSQPSGPPTYLALFISVPLVAFAALYMASARFRVVAHSISLPLIVGAHLWRYVGVGFVMAIFLGKLPPQFGIPEGVGDVIAAAFALPLARALHQGKPVRRLFVAWNVFGLVDLISAITVGVLYSEGSLGILRTGVSTALMTTFPVSLIPTFFVPLFILLHVLALIRSNEVAGARVSWPRV